MAITIIQPIIPSSIMGGFDIPTLPYNDIDSATYKVGAPLVVSAGAELTEATAASPTTGIVGIALQAGTNLTTAPEYPNYGEIYPTGAALSGAGAVSPLLFVPALPGLVFEGTFASNGNDVAIGADGSDLYVKYGLSKDATSGYWYVDKNKTTTNGSVTIVGIKNVQDIVLGTTLGVRVFFVFNITETIYV